MPTRRRILQAAAAGLALPSVARGEAARILKVVPQGDLASLDPMWTTAYQTRDHGFMVFDTLFGVNTQQQPSLQMAGGVVTAQNGLSWHITLREGLLFHDGSKVLARDAAASVRRWGVRDSFGQALLAATDEIAAPDDRTLIFRLKRPFPLLPDALGKTSPSMCPIMPERLAVTDPFSPVTEMVGSGPYRYRADERIPGALVVYERNVDYVPRADGITDGTAGPKRAHFDRVEWHVISDPATAAAALQQGEVDWWLVPDSDLLPALRRQPKLTVDSIWPTGFIATLRFNQLHPPFDDPAVRRAMVRAVSQTDYMIGMVGTDPSLWRDRVGYFCPNTPMANTAGMEALSSPRDLDAVRKALDQAGYANEPVVILTPTDIASARALAEITADTLRRAGMKVEAPAMDWATLVQRRVNTGPVGPVGGPGGGPGGGGPGGGRAETYGGWSIYHTSWAGLDMVNPVGNGFLRGTGRAAAPGWPDSPRIEALRDAWLDAPGQAAQRAIAKQLQLQAFTDVPYIPLGQYFAPTVYQANLTGVVRGSPVFWNLKRL